MIIHLRGSVLDKSEKYLVLDVSGVGYKVFATNDLLFSLHVGEEKSLWIYHALREDASDLFGFPTKTELEFFNMLLSVSGIGPRTALGVMSATTVSVLKRAIVSRDASSLVKTAGIGKKVAEKIVLELQGKCDDFEDTGGDSGDAIEALMALGYRDVQVRKVLKDIDMNLSTEDKIRLALKMLNK